MNKFRYTVLIFLIGLSFNAISAVTYSFPFDGKDFSHDERILRFKQFHNENNISSVQQHGYDLGAVKYNSNSKRWEENNGIQNKDYYLYEKQVYAMRGGKVIACWRNAPENPRAGKLHSAIGNLEDNIADTRIYGGGNSVWIEHDDGSRAEYAHFKPGTVPKSICPNNAALLPNPILSPNVAHAWPHIRLDKDNQVRVKEGQFLGRVGNSGTSSNTHLHIHVEEGGIADKIKSGGMPVKIHFKRGLFASYNSKSVYTDWNSFANQPIPNGPVIIWPTLEKVTEFTRHGISLKEHDHLFTWLAESGLWPEHTDIYTVLNKPFINVIWRNAQSPWLAYYNISGNQHQEKFNFAVKAGFSLAQIDSTIINGKIRYTSFYKKDKAKFIAIHNASKNSFNELKNQAKTQSLRPVSIAIVPYKGTIRYSAVFRSDGPKAWRIEPSIKSSDYQNIYTNYAKKGLLPTFVNSHKVNNQRYLSVIFGDRINAGIDRHGMTGAQAQSTYQEALAAGMQTGGIAGYDGATKSHRFIGFWHLPGTSKAFMKTKSSKSTLQKIKSQSKAMIRSN